MNLLDPTYIRDNVDYSFGDQSGVHLFNGYMKNANIGNLEFISKYNEIKNIRNYMTLFIDNIRLYQRPGIKYTSMEQSNESFRHFKDARVRELSGSDLLKLCGELPDMNFIVFTAFEDTPIDDEIFDKIPENVLGIYASNATTFGGKVHPIPYGIKRKIYESDIMHEVLSNMISLNVEPKKLLYINHSTGTNQFRVKINEYFSKYDWSTIESPVSPSHNDYTNYLSSIKNHKFMICPDGNAIGCECHRDWEVLYMRRVPIVVRSEYLEKIFDGIPVLFVNSFLDVTEELLNNNIHLYEQMQTFDLSKLDIKIIYENILSQYES
jgi:hypothetical protein